MSIDYELTFNFLGMGVCIAAAAYLIYSGQKAAGVLLLIGFALVLVANIHFIYFEPDQMGACWLEKQSYYACLPLEYRLAIHAGQAGHFFIAAGMVVLAWATARRRQRPEVTV